MACCKPCCGCQNCAEGQEGKCCCGGSEGTCCQPGEYCCSGVCEPEPCDGCESDEDCPEGEVCCGGFCQAECVGCCVKDGATVNGVTTQEECEECVQGGVCYQFQAEQNGVCPDGWTSDGYGGCYREDVVEDCTACEGECYPEGDPVGACGTWQEPCEFCGECVSYYTAVEAITGGGGCDTTRRNLQTITIPEDCPSPVWVRITGGVDDDFAIDGEVVQDGLFDSPCNGAHSVDYEFSTEESSFTIETVDNWAGSIAADLTICFYPEEPPP